MEQIKETIENSKKIVIKIGSDGALLTKMEWWIKKSSTT